MFRIGQKVVRVWCTVTHESKWAKLYKFTCPQIGEVVTIKTINDYPDKDTLLTFVEHDNSHLAGEVCRLEPGFAAKHFRPVVERKTDISTFTEMLTPQGVDA